MKIVLIGWNGAKNAGDDAMTLSILYRIKEKYPKTKSVQIISITKDASFKYIKKNDFDFEVKIDRNSAYTQNRILKYILIRTFYPFRMALKNNLIIIGGGSIFHSEGDNRIYLRMITLAKVFNFFKKTKVISIGTSVGPFYTRNAEEKFKKVFNKISEIEVRDKRSYDYCKKILKNSSTKLTLNHDLALDLKKYINLSRDLFQSNTDNNSIAIILRRGKFSAEQKKWLINFLEFLILKNPNIKFKFISFCSYSNPEENDLFEIQDFISLNSSQVKEKIEVYEYQEDLLELFNWLQNSKFIVAARLHGSILAYLLEKKFLMLSYHPKCQDFFNDLNLDNTLLIDELFGENNFEEILSKLS